MQTEIVPTPILVIRSESFDLQSIGRAVLCLEVGKDRLRFMVLDENRHGCWLEDYEFSSLLSDRPITEALPTLFHQHPLLQTADTDRPWKQVRVSVNSSSFTLVPQPLFRKEYAGSYLSLMRGGALPTHEYAQAYEHAEGFYSVFNVEYALAEYLSATYPLQNVRFFHQTSAILQLTAAAARQETPSQTLSLYFEDEFVTLVLRADGKLRYCNRFGFKNAEDLTYYVLYVIDELGLEPLTIHLVLYGEITPFADTYSRLKAFLPHLSVGHTPPGLTLTTDFGDLPEHRYASMYGAALLP